ncbi:hypothetical protein HYX17_05320 [Candidatus Woesearchaeota archaeon]|nr:hypothetical protein [Candidatus Woesearchaeota archaeon]
MKKGLTLAGIVLSLSVSLIPVKMAISQNYNFTNNGEVYVNHPLNIKWGVGSDRNQSPYKAVGLPKKDVSESFNLGYGGEAIVGYIFSNKNPTKEARCFFNKEGWDIGVHEGISGNRIEDIFVYVTEDMVVDKNTKWIKLGRFNVVGTEDNLIRINLPKEVNKGHWVKIKDSADIYSPVPGFDLSTVVYRYPCPNKPLN